MFNWKRKFTAICISELIDEIKKRLNVMSYDEEERVKRLLEQEMARNSAKLIKRQSKGQLDWRAFLPMP